MKRLRRWLFNLAAGVSAVLCALVVVLWVWSYHGDLHGGFRMGYYSRFPFGTGLFPIQHRGYGYVLTTPQGGVQFYWQELRSQQKPLAVGSQFSRVDKTILGFGMNRAPNEIAPGLSRQWADQGAVRIPFWFLLCLCLVLPVWGVIRFGRSVRARWRLAQGHCPLCGYDLRATTDRCPECGAVAGGI